jgi:hypothetical protein
MNIDQEDSRTYSFYREVREIVLAIMAFGIVCECLRVCFATVVSLESSADAKRWAQSVIAAVVGVLVGAVLRR